MRKGKRKERCRYMRSKEDDTRVVGEEAGEEDDEQEEGDEGLGGRGS